MWYWGSSDVSNAQSVHSFTWTSSCLLLIQLSYFTFDLSFFMFLFLVSTNFYSQQFICFVLLFMFGWVSCISQTLYSYLLFFLFVATLHLLLHTLLKVVIYLKFKDFFITKQSFYFRNFQSHETIWLGYESCQWCTPRSMPMNHTECKNLYLGYVKHVC